MNSQRLKVTISLLLVLLVTMSLSVTAFAADTSVDFENGEIIASESDSVYTDSDLFGGFKNVMPGDVLTDTITFTNKLTDCDYVNLYMRAILHDEADNPISPLVLAELTADERRGDNSELAYMQDFLSQLTLKVWKGDKATGELLYAASPDETDALTSNKLLGKYYSGECVTLTVELTVPITMDNAYSDRIGEVDWVFFVEGFHETQLTVRKVWEDDGINRPESITVHLLKDGKYHDQIVLTQDHQWTYTWDKLNADYKWSVIEASVPESYDATYATSGNITTIVNTKQTPPPPAADPVDLTVKKVWDDNGKDRPDRVKMTLYNGEKAVDTVTLGSWNNWTHTWNDLDGSGSWQVLEVNIPKGYVPSYKYNNGVVTVTNTASLIQTGQISWPIPVLSGLGILLVAYGLMVLMKKRKNEHA